MSLGNTAQQAAHVSEAMACQILPSIHVAFQAAHAVVDHGGNDGHIKWFGGHLGSVDDVVEELLAAASFATGFIPGLA